MDKKLVMYSLDHGKLSEITQFLIWVFLVIFTFETIPEMAPYYGFLSLINVTITIVFCVEYILRVWAAPDRANYIFSIMGMVDFISIFPGIMLGFDLKELRIIRVVRLGKLYRNSALQKANVRFVKVYHKIKSDFTIFSLLAFVFLYISSVGVYLFEHQIQPESFGSIPKCFWWAVVTLTTVGYGDSYPMTVGGKIFTTVVVIIGIAVIAIPTGLIAAGLTSVQSED
jgi:voltage-gated potassium channel